MWRCGSGLHQRQQCQLCRERQWGGLYRSGHPRCDRCGGVVQHQRRVWTRPDSASTAAVVSSALSAFPTLKYLPIPTATTAINSWFQRPRRATPCGDPQFDGDGQQCRGRRLDIHQRQQCQLCRKRHRCGLYRSGESDRIGCVGVIQHQRRGRLGQVQHQQQRGGQLCQQPEP